MKQHKIIYVGMIVLSFVLLMISTGYAYPMEQGQADELTLPMEPMVSYKKNVEVQTLNHDFLKLPNDIQIMDTIEDESNPYVVIDSQGNPLVMFDKNYDISQNNLGVHYSPAGGDEWPEEYYYEFSIEDTYMTNPIITLLSNGIGAIGSYNDFISPTPDENFFITSDITDPDTWEFRYWDNSGSSTYILETSSTVTQDDILCFATISDYDTGDQYFIDTFSAHWHLQEEFEYIGGVIFYNTDSEGRSQPLSHLTADAGEKVYFVAEQQRVDGTKLIRAYYSDVGPETQYTDWRSAVVAGGQGNSTYPAISVSGKNAYCAYMTDRNGNQDIYIAKTTSGGFWFKYEVATSPDDELYPTITANGDEVTCLFIKNDNLYMTQSEDAGSTWSEPMMVNDEEGTIVPEYGNVDIEAGAGVWTADTGDSTDLFYEEVGQFPVLAIDSIDGGFGVSATISNVGNAPAEDVPWTIDINGTMLIGSHTEGTINVAEDASATISPGFILGIGQTEITVSVGDKLKTATGFVLGPFVFLN